MNEGLEIKRLEKQDALLFQQLIRLFQKVFQEENPAIPDQCYNGRIDRIELIRK